jgi:hypothetical protein
MTNRPCVRISWPGLLCLVWISPYPLISVRLVADHKAPIGTRRRIYHDAWVRSAACEKTIDGASGGRWAGQNGYPLRCVHQKPQAGGPSVWVTFEARNVAWFRVPGHGARAKRDGGVRLPLFFSLRHAFGLISTARTRTTAFSVSCSSISSRDGRLGPLHGELH